MTKKIIVATTNQGKLKEIKQYLPDYEVLSLADFPNAVDVEETGKTYTENAELKAKALYENIGGGIPVLAEDSGIEVDALTKHYNQVPWGVEGAVPGVYSARYSYLVLGNPYLNHDDSANNDLMLLQLRGESNRKARYVSCFVIYDGTESKSFTGVMEGSIAYEESGQNGFAYDSIFIPNNEDGESIGVTYASLINEDKNRFSHRVKSLNQVIKHLEEAN